MKKQKIKLEHVERLSRGKKSGINIGSRKVGHHLHTHEREEYERARKRGYVVVDERSRENLWNIWEKACLAQEITSVIVEKSKNGSTGLVYQNQKVVFEGALHEAKKHAKSLV